MLWEWLRQEEGVCFTGTEFHFGKMKRILEMVVVAAPQQSERS
jgi:hypothetical protein